MHWCELLFAGKWILFLVVIQIQTQAFICPPKTLLNLNRIWFVCKKFQHFQNFLFWLSGLCFPLSPWVTKQLNAMNLQPTLPHCFRLSSTAFDSCSYIYLMNSWSWTGTTDLIWHCSDQLTDLLTYFGSGDKVKDNTSKRLTI